MRSIGKGRQWAVIGFAAVPVSIALGLLTASCADNAGRDSIGTSQSCMKCHNGSSQDDYAGPGMENPHPFPGADNLQCTVCHGGNGSGGDKDGSHVPPPPEIGDRQNWAQNAEAYFNRLTLAGIDKYPDYTAGGRTYTALDYLQFINPSDLRVATKQRGCGQCHAQHSTSVAGSLLATEAGILSGAMYAIGADNAVPSHRTLFQDTAADFAFRAVSDPGFVPDPSMVGRVGSLLETPVHGRRVTSPENIFKNQAYNVFDLVGDQLADNRVVTNSNLARLFQEQISVTCGDCHLGSAGANNRYGDFRPSGCAACHMRHSSSGRSHTSDPNINRTEPLDPDDIDAPELSHLRRHRIASVAKVLSNGTTIEGIDDHACAGCHQGSNRTVLQYWGIRLDQNQDLRNRVQYPANPVTFRNTANDTRLFDPQVRNNTFNGRNANQYILLEDYDGDGRDDTPPDVHHGAGLGCIDCHGSFDLHGGDVADGGQVQSRMNQASSIKCENCHGGIAAYASTVSATNYGGQPAEVAIDERGAPMRHVIKEGNDFFLYSRLDGRRHYVVQTKDTVDNNGKVNPLTGLPVYNAKASYAMGRFDSDPTNGTGPAQTRGCKADFSHTDNMSCASCHASWTNTCTGCHLEGEYNTGNNFSNITGERIVYKQKFAEFVYQTPVPFVLGVDADNKIGPFASNTKMFFRYRDLNGDRSGVFTFSDRKGGGSNSANAHRALGHNALMAHSIRGKVASDKEGPRYCTACHLTDNSLRFRADYDAFRLAMNTRDWGNLNFNLLRDHIGKNPNNQIDSPIWVHMAVGLGSGLFLFDENGCPMNPLDTNANRFGCEGNAPANNFDPANVVFNLDRMVEGDGRANSSSSQPMLRPAVGPNLRDGASDPNMAGPLGATLLRRLANPDAGDVILLDSWIDADGQLRGDAALYVR